MHAHIHIAHAIHELRYSKQQQSRDQHSGVLVCNGEQAHQGQHLLCQRTAWKDHLLEDDYVGYFNGSPVFLQVFKEGSNRWMTLRQPTILNRIGTVVQQENFEEIIMDYNPWQT